MRPVLVETQTLCGPFLPPSIYHPLNRISPVYSLPSPGCPFLTSLFIILSQRISCLSPFSGAWGVQLETQNLFCPFLTILYLYPSQRNPVYSPFSGVLPLPSSIYHPSHRIFLLLFSLRLLRWPSCSSSPETFVSISYLIYLSMPSPTCPSLPPLFIIFSQRISCYSPPSRCLGVRRDADLWSVLSYLLYLPSFSKRGPGCFRRDATFLSFYILLNVIRVLFSLPPLFIILLTVSPVISPPSQVAWVFVETQKLSWSLNSFSNVGLVFGPRRQDLSESLIILLTWPGCSWRRRPSSPSTTPSITQKEPRFSLARNDHKHWYLKISDVRSSDRGQYMCQVNSDPMINQVGYLDVQVLPLFPHYLTHIPYPPLFPSPTPSLSCPNSPPSPLPPLLIPNPTPYLPLTPPSSPTLRPNSPTPPTHSPSSTPTLRPNPHSPPLPPSPVTPPTLTPPYLPHTPHLPLPHFLLPLTPPHPPTPPPELPTHPLLSPPSPPYPSYLPTPYSPLPPSPPPHPAPKLFPAAPRMKSFTGPYKSVGLISERGRLRGSRSAQVSGSIHRGKLLSTSSLTPPPQLPPPTRFLTPGPKPFFSTLSPPHLPLLPPPSPPPLLLLHPSFTPPPHPYFTPSSYTPPIHPLLLHLSFSHLLLLHPSFSSTSPSPLLLLTHSLIPQHLSTPPPPCTLFQSLPLPSFHSPFSPISNSWSYTLIPLQPSLLLHPSLSTLLLSIPPFSTPYLLIHSSSTLLPLLIPSTPFISFSTPPPPHLQFLAIYPPIPLNLDNPFSYLLISIVLALSILLILQ
ncbi:hypothetical protein C7M84_007236 [Penaeus vannamei]|uniref:Ig-like domain-containing protein n=1 Tax=Penaeus vannamei TaxID=6689 RepID=A0A423TCQ3_PENVA|nr:hypothetical protein C7M84_007236 [Penaeus vannamei]